MLVNQLDKSQKLCRDCKHFREKEYNYYPTEYFCMHNPRLIKTTVDTVALGNSCATYRHNNCGLEAKFFEQKELTVMQRVLRKLKGN
jgi:hypothetical protein